MVYRVNVQLVLDVDCEAEAFDAVNEILREQQRHFFATSCLVDYRTETPQSDPAISLGNYILDSRLHIG